MSWGIALFFINQATLGVGILISVALWLMLGGYALRVRQAEVYHRELLRELYARMQPQVEGSNLSVTVRQPKVSREG